MEVLSQLQRARIKLLRRVRRLMLHSREYGRYGTARLPAHTLMQAGGPPWGMPAHDFNFIRLLCDHIATEQNPQKGQALCELLRAVVRENDEEVALRLKFFNKKYGLALGVPPKGPAGLSALPKLDLLRVRPDRKASS